jgi:hypothetical protein
VSGFRTAGRFSPWPGWSAGVGPGERYLRPTAPPPRLVGAVKHCVAGTLHFSVAMPITWPMPKIGPFVLAALWVVFAAVLGPSPAWLFGALGLMLAFVYVWVLRDPRIARRGPAALLDASFLLFELVLFLLVGGYFRMWMVAALVLATLLASALGLFTQGRERRQVAMYTAIGLPVILVLAVLAFVEIKRPFF